MVKEEIERGERERGGGCKSLLLQCGAFVLA